MVYCNLEKVDGNKVLYSIGGYSDDITGKLLIDFKTQEYILLEEPKNSKVYDYFIKRLLSKHQSNFEKGIFKQRISYEI